MTNAAAAIIDPACAGQSELFGRTDARSFLLAAEQCDYCPALEACTLLADAERQVDPPHRYTGTIAGVLFGDKGIVQTSREQAHKRARKQAAAKKNPARVGTSIARAAAQRAGITLDQLRTGTGPVEVAARADAIRRMKGRGLSVRVITAAAGSAKEDADVATQILAAVVEHAQVTTADLLTFTRAKPVLEARWLAYWLLVNVGGLSYAATGRLLSRDHSTVITAVNRVDADPGLLAVAQEIAGRMKDEVAA